MKQDNFPFLILTLAIFLLIGVAIMAFCIKRVLFHQNELQKGKLSKEKRFFEKTKLNMMIINTVASIIWVTFFAIRSAITILQYLK